MKRKLSAVRALVFGFAGLAGFVASEPSATNSSGQSHEVVYGGGGVPVSAYLPKVRAKGRSLASADERARIDTRVARSTDLEIPAGEIAYLDQNLDVGALRINGQLHCPPTDGNAPPTIEIKARSIYVNGLFQCGTSAAPFLGKLTISLKPSDVDPATNPAYRGIMVNPGGNLVLTGRGGKAGWSKLARTIEPGQETIMLDRAVDGWEVGDEVVIAPTSYDAAEAESFTIAAVRGAEVRLDKPVQFRHWGELQILQPVPKKSRFANLLPLDRGIRLDQRAEVANLTRNIRLRADESQAVISDADAPGAELGGHVMAMIGGGAYLDGVEFYRMGQAGILGRYPFHWHVAGNVQGQFIRNSSVHRSFQRCITVHRTDFAEVSNNTCYDFKGHGYFLEDGTEKNNRIVHNLGILAKHPYRSKSLLASDMTASGSSPMGEYQGRFPNVSVFWMSHPQNDIRDNVAAGSLGTGFWMGYHQSVTDNDGQTLDPLHTNLLNFANNTAHSALVGFTWDGGPNGPSANNPRNPLDRELAAWPYEPAEAPVFRGLKAFKNSYTGIYFRGVRGTFENALTADNGWHFWLSFNQIVRNSTMVGRSANHSDHDQHLLDTNLGKSYIAVSTRRAAQAGILFYDGPFEIDGVDFLNYPTAPVYRAADQADITPTPVGIAGGTEAFMNVSRRIGFSPVPLRKFGITDYNQASLLRDLDGTFAGRNSGAVMVGKRSTGIFPNSGCQTDDPVFGNMAVCPANYSESSFNIFDGTNAWGINGQSYSVGMFAQSFVARRSDGTFTNPLAQWPGIFLYGQPWTGNGTKFGFPTTPGQDLELLLKRERPSLWLNAESLGSAVPVTRLIAQGKGCRLVPKTPPQDLPAQGVGSLAALRAATESAYFTQGEDFYVRLIPDRSVFPATGAAQAFTSGHYYVECDAPVENTVRGMVEPIVTQGFGANRSATVRGWACHFNRGAKVGVRISVRDPRSKQGTVLQNVTANLASDENVSFRCGTGASGFRYSYTLSPALVKAYEGLPIDVEGISALAGYPNAFLSGSGQRYVPRELRPVTAPLTPADSSSL